MTNIFTIGYEGSDITSFLATLVNEQVDVLIDVREIPISRKKGFSKTALSQALEQAGIAYVHERSLGSPKPIRDRLKSDGDYKTFFQDYDAYLETQEPSLNRLASDVEGSVALMCYEKNVLECHRRSVARELGKMRGVKPRHLKVEHHAEGNDRASLDSGKSLSTGEQTVRRDSLLRGHI